MYLLWEVMPFKSSPLLRLPHLRCSDFTSPGTPATPLPAESPYVLHQVALAAIVTVTWEEVTH